MRAWIVLLAVLAAGRHSEAPLSPWGANHHATDTPRRHVEAITAGRHAYAVHHGGTMDGANCRSPLGVGMMEGPAIEQVWESNRAVRLENVGETDVVNPWVSNGRNNFRTLDEIVAAAVQPGMTDREKAFALWYQEVRHRYHWEGDNDELGDPVKVFNVYGHNTCGNDSICLAGLWRRAGLKVTPARVVGHCISQAFFDGRWNLFDGDMHTFYLLRDNQTVAGEQDLVRDHDLVKRSHTQGILNPDSRANDEWEASLYVFEGEPVGDRNCAAGTSMDMVLRPGEAVTWRWGHPDPVKYHGGNPPKYPDLVANGLWEYRPDFARPQIWTRGTAVVEGVDVRGGQLAARGEQPGVVVWTMRSPYVLVGGRLEAEGSGVKFALSWDGKSWLGAGPDLDPFFLPNGPARYEYRLRCELAPGGRLGRLRIVNDLQMAPLALPGMTVGENRFVYTDQSPGGRQVRVTHQWVERSASRPPEASAGAVSPPAGGEADAAALVFRWTPASDPDGDRIADYQFELSDRPDLRWPLSTNFSRLISKTADRGRAQYSLPHDGLLTGGRAYYWRVRARDEAGVWGGWSPTWSFTARGHAVPTDLTLAVDPERGTGILRWKAPPGGAAPSSYRVYGSDEKGFTASDGPLKITVGTSKTVPATCPGNFVAEVRGTELAVIGAAVRLPNANRAYYRVVAVDGQGRRSGPSDYAEAPRPILWSRPVAVARVRSPYRYPLAVVRSLGDLRTRVVDGRETMSYWDVEVPRFALQQGPAWLSIDERTGLLSGTPDAAGKVAVVVTATIDREVRKLDPQLLSWGIEKVLSTGTQRVGLASQRFTIRITP
jgi:hypothetical protein